MEGRELETFLTLVLADQHSELARAHDELYPERVPEGIPLSLTLLYPFAPPAEAEDGRRFAEENLDLAVWVERVFALYDEALSPVPSRAA